MFTWICPKCGREVPPSYTECPDCTKSNAEPLAPVQAAPTAPIPTMAPPGAAPRAQTTAPAASQQYSAPPQQYMAPPQQYAAPPQQYTAPPQYYGAPPARSGLPTWLMSILFAFAFVGLGAGVYWAIQHFKGDGEPVSASATALENPASKAAARPNPYQKYVEVAGVRLYQNSKKKVEARFLVVNHSEGELTDLAGTVDIKGRTAKEGEEPVGSFKFKVASIGPNESKEVTAPVDTKLRVYELPDWQLVDAKVQLTQ